MTIGVGEDFSPPASKPRLPAYPRRKRNRLVSEVYKEGGAFFLTTTVRERRKAFSNDQAANTCIRALTKVAAAAIVQIDSYCLMPDHLHLLVVAEEGIDVLAFMRRFKQTAAIECNRALGWRGSFWQSSYYDHVVRRIENMESIRDYIVGNPIRAGIVENPEDYPFSAAVATERGRED